MEQSEKLDTWAIVELFGHQRIAGRVMEATVAGGAFLRVDVPAVGERLGFTRLYSPNAIYSITPVDEATARRALVAIQPPPITIYVPPALPGGRDDDEDLYTDDDDSYDDDEPLADSVF